MPTAYGYAYASTGKRCAATAIDIMLLAVVAAVSYAAMLRIGHGNPLAFALVCTVCTGALTWGWEATRGGTVGKSLMRLRTVRDDRYAGDPRRGLLPAGLLRMSIRYAMTMASMLIVVVGVLLLEMTSLADKGKRRGWQDRLSGTAVIDISSRSTEPLLAFESLGDRPIPLDITGAGTSKTPFSNISASDHAASALAPPPTVERAHRAQAAPPIATRTGHRQSPAAAPAGFPQPAAAHAIVPPPTPVPTGSPAVVSGIALPSPKTSAPSEPTAARPKAMLYFEDGSSRELDIPSKAKLGRNPTGDDPSEILVRVPDTTGTMSRTHAMLEISSGRMWLTDLGSMNGTEIITDDNGVQRLVPHTRTQIPFGTRITLGNTALSVTLMRNRERK